VEVLAIVAGFVVAYGMVSRRITSTWLTGPIVFVGFGILLGATGLDILEDGLDNEPLRLLAEATLVLLLFSDAARIELRLLRQEKQIPIRLLALGLPLTIVFGTIVAAVVFTDLAFLEAAVLAAILAPTDAALGQAVVTSRHVPVRIRQALNVESGLNDGIALPVITVLAAAAAAGSDLGVTNGWTAFAFEQIGWGVGAGMTAGYLGARAIEWATTRRWMDGVYRQLAALSVGVGAFALAGTGPLDGNGFVAAFVAGLTFSTTAPEACEDALDFTEDEGQLLALLTFLVFGAVIAEPRLDELRLDIFVYAVLSLTVIRMLPVAFSLLGAKLRWETHLFLGWFGPRGLASILFGLFILEEASLAGADEIVLVVTWTVLLSVLLHGATSAPLSAAYGDRVGAMEREHPGMPEAVEVPEIRARYPRQGDM
jgi:NhaP-type Na+/H+ or K+/H+ antiporter